MFGKNEITKQFLNESGDLLVNEIFYTIQGEGPDAGCPAVFIRLAKCNLRCYFCDTEFESGHEQSVENICGAVQVMTQNNNCRLVVITGGEPFLQNVVPLVRMLNYNGIRVSFETAGTVWSPMFEDLFHRSERLGASSKNRLVCSPKTSGINRAVPFFVSAWKYIIAVGEVDMTTGLPRMSTQIEGQAHPIYKPPKENTAPIYLQPMDCKDVVQNDDNMKLARDLCMRFGYRLSLQVHKIVGLP